MRFGSLSLIAGCALLAVNYIYYAFFVAFSLIVAATLATRSGDRRFVRFGLVCLGVVCVVTAFNLAPTYLAWSREGEPVTMFHKVPAEAEIYGLKIRHLITPEPDHTFGPFRTMSELTAEAHFPLENENMTARLGLVASSGFLFLLGVIFHPQAVSALAHRDLIAAGARVTLACLLLATVGGFGSVFNLLIAPDVRTYNRVAPLIAFFSLAALAFLLDGVRWGKRVSGTLLAAAILALGVWDQTHAFARLARSAPAVASDFAALNVQVAQIESRLPENAAVYQLPFSYFLGDAGIVRMAPYESAALPFASTTLRWSFPAMSNESTFWGRRVSRLPVPEMLAALRAAGFSALCLNRLGYDDNAHTLESALTTLLGAESVILSDLRYLVFDIRSIPIPDDAALEPDRLSVDPRTVATSVGLPPCSTKQAVGFVDQLNSRRVLAGAHPVVRSGVDLTVRGWAVWDATKTEVGSVDVLVDGVPFGSYYGIERPDVAAGYNQSGYRLTGYVTTVPSDKVTEGGHTLVIRAVAPDRHCYDDVATTGFVVR
jgi:phosphoglycerol transferase